MSIFAKIKHWFMDLAGIYPYEPPARVEEDSSPVRICVSDIGEEHKEYGSYNVYSKGAKGD